MMACFIPVPRREGNRFDGAGLAEARPAQVVGDDAQRVCARRELARVPPLAPAEQEWGRPPIAERLAVDEELDTMNRPARVPVLDDGLYPRRPGEHLTGLQPEHLDHRVLGDRSTCGRGGIGEPVSRATCSKNCHLTGVLMRQLVGGDWKPSR